MVVFADETDAGSSIEPAVWKKNNAQIAEIFAKYGVYSDGIRGNFCLAIIDAFQLGRFETVLIYDSDFYKLLKIAFKLRLPFSGVFEIGSLEDGEELNFSVFLNSKNEAFLKRK